MPRIYKEDLKVKGRVIIEFFLKVVWGRTGYRSMLDLSIIGIGSKSVKIKELLCESGVLYFS